MRKPATSRILVIFLGLSLMGSGTAVAAAAQEAPAKESRAAVLQEDPTPQWAVQLPDGADADAVAADLGFANLGQIGTLTGFYLFDKLPEPELPAGFENDPALVAQIEDRLQARTIWFEQQIARQQEARQPTGRAPTDPLYADQWHLENTGQSGGTAGEDANVVPAWDAGYTGAGVTVAIVDDGLEHAHPDLSAKYVPAASWDYNDGDADPSPGPGNSHGTAVGGVAAADDDGATCGVGSAFGADVSGIRLTAGLTTDAQEADALTLAYQTNDVFNNSWGPSDNGQTLAGPGTLTRAALEDAVTNGRGGLGTIYVWAAGNGLENFDNVNYDGYASSRFSIAVGATDHDGVQSFYSEPGAAMLVNAPSNSTVSGVTTTDRLGANGYSSTDCTDTFGGTSSASPLVAGVAALILDANPALTWRDVQHILVETADQNDPGDGDWVTNGAGHLVNHKYGFGRIDAGAATAAATGWTNVAAATSYTSGTLAVGQAIPDNNPAGVTDTFVVPDDIVIEHVEVVFDATHTYRGDLEIVLTSPSGTDSVLAELHNDPNDNYNNWRFMSVRHWDESSAGTWSLNVSDNFAADTGTFNSWELVIHGVGDTTPNNPPSVSGASFSIAEDAAVGATVGTVSASDPDSDPLFYSITAGNTGGAFAIGSSNGKITVAKALDHETKANYTLTVEVSDGKASDTATVTIGVTDVNEAPIVSSGSFSIAEDAAVGATVGTVSASDPDGHTLAYSITAGNTDGAFAIGSTNGKITVAKALDYETKASYSLTVSATDGSLSDSAIATINVTDVAEFIVPSVATFGDVPLSYLFFPDVEWMAWTGVTKGCNPPTNDLFCPDALVTRGQMAAFLHRALEDVLVPGAVVDFVDDDGSVFEADIEWLGATGVTKGCNPPTNDQFCPDAFVSRGQMAAFLHRALGDG